jgi:hypothetical protein
MVNVIVAAVNIHLVNWMTMVIVNTVLNIIILPTWMMNHNEIETGESMKIYNGNHISFKSEPFWYLKEKYGNKPNTIRFLSGDEYKLVKDHMFQLKKITIINADTAETFIRDLTDVSILPFDDVLLKGHLVIFSWKSYMLIDN